MYADEKIQAGLSGSETCETIEKQFWTGKNANR